MKALILTLAAALTITAASAQKVQKFTATKGADMGLTYSLPTTHLRMVAVAEKTVRKAGPYYKYAQKYLGTTDVVTADEQTWTLKAVMMQPVGVPAATPQYVIQYKSGQAPFIMRTDDGLLLAINTENYVEPRQEVVLRAQDASVLDDNAYLSSLSGEMLASESLSKRAEMAAQEIYRIRQSRSDYITGEADVMPDGAALAIIMRQLDEQEAALTALFVGTTQRSEDVRTLTYEPGDIDVDNVVLFRVSDENGIVDRNDLSGEPVYLSMKVTHRPTMPLNEKGETKRIPKDALIYKIPGKALFTITYEGEDMASEAFDLAQLGIDFGLDPAIFTDKRQPATAKFSPSTGAIVELSSK